ncbi:MAG: hypothetical protein P3C10_15710, partial [Gemmatimonadota bacterium]|nr:hypothetical protein [Gemmatimonadota bacterium]
MRPTFELVETAPRPSPALRTALLAIEALRRQTCLAEVVVDECRIRFPTVAALDNVGPVGDRLREHLEAYADHEAILRWMKEADWPYRPDLTWAKKSRKRAWIRLRKAARRLEPLVHPPPAVPTPS